MNKIINGVASEYDMPNLYEVNGIQCTDNIPNNMFIGVTKEQYCEYQQLKEENNKLKKEKEDLQNELDSANSRDCDLAMRIAKAINLIENGDLLYLASKCSTIYKDNIEIVAIYDRLRGLLEILKGEDK